MVLHYSREISAKFQVTNTSMIPSKTFLMFRSWIHLALAFCVWCKVTVQLHSFPDGTPVSRHCVDSFPRLGTGVEIQLTV